MLTALGLLDSHELLKPDSPISNIPLVVSLYLKFVSDMSDLDEGHGEFGWAEIAVEMLDKANIKFKDVKNYARGTERRVGEIRDATDEDEDDEDDKDDEEDKDDDIEGDDKKTTTKLTRQMIGNQMIGNQ